MNSLGLFDDAIKDIQKNGANLTIRTEGEGIEISGDCTGAFVLLALSVIADDLRYKLKQTGVDEADINSLLLAAVMYDNEKFATEMMGKMS